jgi:hypothetical protein
MTMDDQDGYGATRVDTAEQTQYPGGAVYTSSWPPFRQ